MGKKRKTGAYPHFCVLIIAQGTWKDDDKKEIKSLIIEKSKQLSDISYNVFDKLVYREEKPTYADCQICGPIYELFEEIRKSNDSILYQGHHYLVPEDDFAHMKELANLIISHEKVKKFYLLYLDGLGDLKRTDIAQMKKQDIRKLITSQTCKINEFNENLDRNEFIFRRMYEITKKYF